MEEPLGKAWREAYAVFCNGSLPDDERIEAVQRGYELCYDWIQEHPAPFPPELKADFEALRGAMELGARLATGYVDLARAHTIHRAWFDSLTVHCADGTNEALFAEELDRRVQFVLHHGSLATVESLLTDETLTRIERLGTESPIADSISQLRVLRADIRRTRGAFRGALEDLEIAKARLEGPSGEMSSEGRGAYEAVAVKIAIDLGLLDRASASLGHLKRLTAGKGERAFERQRFQLAYARYHQANGHFQWALEAATETLPKGTDFESEQLSPSDHEARALVLRAIVLSKLARTRAEKDAAVRAIRLEKRRAAADEASLVPLDIELAAILIASDDNADRAEAYSIAASVLSQLEEGHSSTLFTARAAAQLYDLVGGMGIPEEVERARAVLEGSAADLVHSWRDIGRFDGGIGFLDFPERLAVASAWITCRINSPGGARYALQGLLEIDRCSQLAQSLAERSPASQAMTIDVDDLIALTRAHGSVLVWYLPTPERTHRFTVSQDGVEYAALDPLRAFKDPIERVSQWLRLRPDAGQETLVGPRIAADLEWLAAELLPAPFAPEEDVHPEMARMGSGTAMPSLWLTGLDAFGGAPFEALPSASGKAVGLTVSVVRLPSLTCAVHAAFAAPERRPRQKKGTFEVFTPAMEKHPNGDISLRMDEILTLRRLGAGHARFGLTGGPAATRQGFARAVGSGAELFVAWTHGRYDRRRKRPAGLDVSPSTGDGFDLVDADFVEATLQAPGLVGIPRVVYLAACDATRGHRRTGDAGASHLGGAFLGAGVPVVIASGEQNDRDATSVHLQEFTDAFLKRGTSAEQAMLEARLEVERRPEFAHPHFWAGLQILGWGPTRRP